MSHHVVRLPYIIAHTHKRHVCVPPIYGTPCCYGTSNPPQCGCCSQGEQHNTNTDGILATSKETGLCGLSVCPLRVMCTGCVQYESTLSPTWIQLWTAHPWIWGPTSTPFFTQPYPNLTLTALPLMFPTLIPHPCPCHTCMPPPLPRRCQGIFDGTKIRTVVGESQAVQSG